MSRKLALATVAGALLTPALWRRARAASLQGRVALVTGGSRGLGLAVADELLGRGARVAVCGRDQKALDAAKAALGERHPDADLLTVRCDVARKTHVKQMLSLVEERLGPVDVLVLNAGVISVGPVETQKLADFEQEMDVQFWGAVYPTLQLLPAMRERGFGRIAFVTSIGGKVSVPWLLPYNASKYALVGFSDGLRAELAGSGVKVTTVVPWLMRTGSYVSAYFKGQEPEREYALFTPLSATPLTAVSARRAAKKIVNALERGQAELLIGWEAKLLARVSGVAPGLTADTLGVVKRVLPEVSGQEAHRGSELEPRVDADRFRLTRAGRKAVRELNQEVLFEGDAEARLEMDAKSVQAD